VTAATAGRPAAARAANGGAAARRAVIRWGWRLFRREWRQQLLILALLTVAVAAMIFAAGVATNTPPSSPNAATFGTARALVTLPGGDPHLAAGIAALRQRYGRVSVIENKSLRTGLVGGVELRSQDPASPYGGPMLALVAGRYPTGPGQAALTRRAAVLYQVGIGGTWHAGGRTWRVTGLVENPSNLLDEFALVAPGQISTPDQVSVLLGVSHVTASGLPAGAAVAYPRAPAGGISPATVVLVVAVLGLVFIGLVGVSGFMVMAQRRLRALGMLSALGATPGHVRLVMVANGAVVGIVAALAGAVLGFGAWFGYAPRLETVTAHRVDPLNLPWWAIATGLVLAVATAVAAARWPARTVAQLPVVAALSGRPAPPKTVRRSAWRGLVLLAVAVALLLMSGGWGANGGPDILYLLGGLVAIVAADVMLAPACVTLLTRAARPGLPVGVRLALRDLARYRARSASALAAASFAVFLAVLICIIASVRFANVLDYVGPNLTANQLIVYTTPQATGPGVTPAPPSARQLSVLGSRVATLATSLHAQYVLPLASAGKGGPGGNTPDATLVQRGTSNNNYSGPLYVATPALLHRYGIRPAQIKPGTDVLTMRPGLAGQPRMLLLVPPPLPSPGDKAPAGPRGGPCPAGSCLASPRMQTVRGLPAGTSAPNTVITMHAVRALGLRLDPSGWLIQTARPLTSMQISAVRQFAVAAGVSAETKSGELGLSQISDGATALGILVALGVLAMTVGLIRSETAGDLRTLTATGASGGKRRALTAATAGTLALAGALLGTASAALAALAWAHASLSTTFGHVPLPDLAIVLAGLPLTAVLGGWLLAGREQPAIARQPLE
jgi:putative ABC transport system permease protein